MDTSTTTRIAGRVRTLMDEQGVTQLGLSESTGIARATLLRRLNGHASFTIGELDAIASHLGVTLSDLTAETEPAA